MVDARPDTCYLGESPITTDTSQWGTDLTAAAPGGYELASERTALDGTGTGRTIEVAAEVSNAVDGFLVDHYGAAAPYRIRVSEGKVIFSNSAATLASLTPPGIGATAAAYVIAWATEPNPATTGASDALRSEFLVYEVATGDMVRSVALHAVAVADEDDTFTVAGRWDGGSMTNTYANTIDAVRISGRFHARPEIREHFVAATSEPTIEGITAGEDVVWPAKATEAGDGAGPAYQAAAAAMQTGRNRHRMISPVLQWMVQQPPTYEDDIGDTVPVKWVHELGDGWQASCAWLAKRRVPRHCAYLLVTVQWATWDTDASGSPDEVELRFNTSDARPSNNPQRISSVTITRDTDDGDNGMGALESFALCYVERNDDGETWCWLSARVDGGSGSGNVAYSIRQLTAVPVSLSEGYDQDPPNGWGP